MTVSVLESTSTPSLLQLVRVAVAARPVGSSRDDSRGGDRSERFVREADADEPDGFEIARGAPDDIFNRRRHAMAWRVEPLGQERPRRSQLGWRLRDP